MDPLLTLITPHEAIRAVLIIGLHADGAVAALLVALVAVGAETGFIGPFALRE